MDELVIESRITGMSASNTLVDDVQNVLIVSHDAAVTSQLRDYLEQDHAARVIVAASVDDATRHIATESIQAVFVDFQLDHTWNDLDFLEKCRTYQSGTVPIYALIHR